MGFIFGEGTPWTYEDIQRKRKIADALIAGNSRAPQNVGEGLTAIGRAIGARMIEKKAGKYDKENRDNFNGKWGEIVGGLSKAHTPIFPQTSPQQPAYTHMPQGNNTPEAAQSADTQMPRDQAMDGAFAGVVDAGPGWTEVKMADGTTARLEGTRAWRNNNPGNIEFGGFARKHAAVGTDGRFAVFPTYEAGRKAKAALLFESPSYRHRTILGAINRYAPPNENDTNRYASTVAQSVGAPLDMPISALSPQQREAMLDAMEKVEGFRPGTINGTESRVAQAPVAGGGGVRSTVGTEGAAGQMGGADLDTLMELASSPYASDAQRMVLSRLIERAMPMPQTEQERIDLELKRLQLEQARNPRVSEADRLDLERRRIEVEQLRNPKPETTDDMLEYQYARQQGYQGSFQDFITGNKKAGAPSVSTTVNTGNPIDARPMADKPDKGYQRRWDAERQTWVDEPIPGGDAAREQAESERADRLRAENDDTATSIVTTAASRAREAAGKQNFGSIGTSLVGKIPFTDSAEVMRQVDTLKSMAAAENLNAMRAESKTGGALGNVTEKELALLQNKSGALNPDSPNFARDLEDYERTLLRTIHGKEDGDRVFEASRASAQTPEADDGGWVEIDGVRIREKR